MQYSTTVRARSGARVRIGLPAAVCLGVMLLGSPGAAAAPVSPRHPIDFDLPPDRGTAADRCVFSEIELQFIQYLIGSLQNRLKLTCNPRLQTYARTRARDMAARGYLSHITPDRKGPNRQLREMGYPLPDSYLNGLANNIESIVGGIEAPAAVWRALVDSADHRPHLLGEDAGFLAQDEFGVAYYRDLYAPHVDYWVVVIARRPRPGEARLICTPAPSVCFRTGTVGDATDAGTPVVVE